MNESLKRIAESFAIQGDVTQLLPLGNGHIHDTYLVRTSAQKGYVLQRMNTRVFPNPAAVMHNIALVTEHIRAVQPAQPCLAVIPTKGGHAFLARMGRVFRMLSYIGNSFAPEESTSPVAIETGRAFGGFLKALEGFDASLLKVTLPRFHDTPFRFAQLMQAAQADKAGRADSVQKELAVFQTQQGLYPCLIQALADGNIPLRVTHNDAKPNNVLLERKTERALCVVDLDTVMPGTALYDYADMLRCGASTAAEDEPDTAKVAFSQPMALAYTRGYLAGAQGCLTKAELGLLARSAIVITLEQAMRFLTDYLCGDVYYKVAYPQHNLVRARAQLALAQSMQMQQSAFEQKIMELF